LAFGLKFSIVCREGKFVGDVPTFFIGQGLYIRIRKLIMVGVVLVVVVVDVLVWC